MTKREEELQDEIEDLITENDALFAELDKFREALIWCSGSPDFNVGGQARAVYRVTNKSRFVRIKSVTSESLN